MVTVAFVFGFLLTCVCADRVADVVLSCTLVEEGVGLGGVGGGSLFTHTPATLVLRDVPVASDEPLETLTSFVPPSIPDPDALLLEVKVASPEIPNTHVLLHADCNEQEGGEFSTVLILRTLAVKKDHLTLIQNKLGLPLSQSGTLLTEVIFLVFSHEKSVSAPLRGDVILNCGFKQQEIPLAQEVSVEWRLQHRGKGGKVFEMMTRLDEAEGSTVVHAERRGSSMAASQVVGEGNASVTLTKLKLLDEGTYICTVSIGIVHAQQVIQLQVVQPPRVSLSEEKQSQTLSCHCATYYPLEAQMQWLSLSPADTEPTVLPDQGSLSSHRQHGDGTYSLSSHLSVPPTVSPGTTITCRVSHPALDGPLSISLVVERPQAGFYWWLLGFLVVTLLFFYKVMR
ncbi:tapasin-related protein isoform X2 [Pseudoliparis swirei]|uniref:tapasin-related protein isoform X2 n=1 Tax=Pseudoliparis swirei TaxID=2059687 RepID=UPI0024BE6233|nr:tapasin-related protein isoform X2 [Pseudoliparis swirei]